MAKSMTGYGVSSFHLENTTITVEIRSVNHRFLDILPKIPRNFLFLEEKIKRIIKSYFSRGRIEIYINAWGKGLTYRQVMTDWNLMDQLMEQLESAKERYALNTDIPLSVVTQFPDLITIQEKEEQPSDLQDKLLICLDEACQKVLDMRVNEGENLIDDMMGHVALIRKMVFKLEERRENVIHEYRTRIKQRIEEYIEDPISLDATRVHQEIALLAEKGDITEEITRLHSHLNQIENISKNNEPIGRKLDFIVQEMNREANTIGSKSTDVHISEWTVTMKSEIEKIKEQVQNIE